MAANKAEVTNNKRRNEKQDSNENPAQISSVCGPIFKFMPIWFGVHSNPRERPQVLAKVLQVHDLFLVSLVCIMTILILVNRMCLRYDVPQQSPLPSDSPALVCLICFVLCPSSEK
jgi:hypothetical protein